jgi:Xaa-Pro aminopeptidase
LIAERLKAIRPLIEAAGVDALIITNPVNRLYLSGFTGSSGLLLISNEQAFLVTDFRYIEQAKNQSVGFKIIRQHEELYPGLSDTVKQAGWTKVGFETKHLTYNVYSEMEEKLPVEMVPVEGIVEKLRMVKNAEELAIMTRGAAIIDKAFDYLLKIIRPGMTERELALELEIYLLRKGAEERSFKFIVASGLRGALPHGTASDKVMEKGELVTIDFGAVFEGYATDMTRTIALGIPGQLQCDIYNLVYKAQAEARAAVAPGIRTKEIDSTARVIIEESGYGEYFGHGLGHGIGLETHEAPNVNQRSDTLLEPGMVITVEPGVYLPGLGGVRIEDMVSVTADGVKLLTDSPRELINV